VYQVIVAGLCFLRTRGICDDLKLTANKYLRNSSVFNEDITRFIRSNVSVNTGPVYDVISLKYMIKS
jgi:hypothetical protein